MSKNVLIDEGGTSKSFTNVEKLQTSALGGGYTTWIPEDEADDYANVHKATFTKNGTYAAKAEGAVGFSEVTVNVPQIEGVGEVDIIVEDLTTNITPYILRPNIRISGDSYEWVKGRDEGNNPIRTFTDPNRRTTKEYYMISGNHSYLVHADLVSVEDFTDIADSDTTLQTYKGKQIYFKSIVNFSEGYTTVSPKTTDPTISDYVEDMYKCRRLNLTQNVKYLINGYSNTSQQTVEQEIVTNYNSGIMLSDDVDINYSNTLAERIFSQTIAISGIKTGFVIKNNKQSGETNAYLRSANVDTLIRPEYYYASVEDATAAQPPIGSKVYVKAGETIVID